MQGGDLCKKSLPELSCLKIVNGKIIFVRGKGAKAEPRQRSESRGSLLTLPSRKEEKPAQQD